MAVAVTMSTTTEMEREADHTAEREGQQLPFSACAT